MYYAAMQVFESMICEIHGHLVRQPIVRARDQRPWIFLHPLGAVLDDPLDSELRGRWLRTSVRWTWT